MARSVRIRFNHRLEVGLVWCVIFAVFNEKRRGRSNRKMKTNPTNRTLRLRKFCAFGFNFDRLLYEWVQLLRMNFSVSINVCHPNCVEQSLIIVVH